MSWIPDLGLYDAAEALYTDVTGAVEQVYTDATIAGGDQREFIQGEVSKTTSQVGALTDKGADTAADNTPSGLLGKVRDNALIVGGSLLGLAGVAWAVFA